MKQFGLRYLYRNLGKSLKQIPFEITNHNKVVAVVLEPKEYERLKPFIMGLKTLVREEKE